jgi:O-acetyl-ADP-ribose deacetylase (regulator of RNase III)
VTPAGKLAAKVVIHAVSLDRDRRTSGPVIEAAVRSAMARAREIGATSIAFPALGTGVGGFPLDEAAHITVETVATSWTTAHSSSTSSSPCAVPPPTRPSAPSSMGQAKATAGESTVGGPA